MAPADLQRLPGLLEQALHNHRDENSHQLGPLRVSRAWYGPSSRPQECRRAIFHAMEALLEPVPERYRRGTALLPRWRRSNGLAGR